MDTKYSAIVYAVEEKPAAWGGMLQEKLGGKAVLNHSLDMFEGDPACAEILVLADPATREWMGGNPLEFASSKQRVLPASATRSSSLAAGAQAAQHPLLVLHDALRPNAGAELLNRVLATAKPGQGAAPAVAITRAIALADPLAGQADKGAGDNFLGPKADHRIALVSGAPPSGALYAVQSPQAYQRADYLRAVAAAVGAELDGSLLCHGAGIAVALVRGRLENLRLDSEDELRVLQKLMGSGPKKKEKYTGLGW